jgi:hypothetical protein
MFHPVGLSCRLDSWSLGALSTPSMLAVSSQSDANALKLSVIPRAAISKVRTACLLINNYFLNFLRLGSPIGSMPVDLQISLLLQIARSFARVSAYSSFRGTQSSASNWVFIFLGGVVQPINWYIPTTASPASVVHSTWMTSPLSSPSQILASLGFSILLLTVLLEAIGKRIAADWSIQGQAGSHQRLLRPMRETSSSWTLRLRDGQVRPGQIPAISSSAIADPLSHAASARALVAQSPPA